MGFHKKLKNQVDFNEETFSKWQVGRTARVTNKYVFTIMDLSHILDVFAPAEANAYYGVCENNVLNLRFYNLPSLVEASQGVKALGRGIQENAVDTIDDKPYSQHRVH